MKEYLCSLAKSLSKQAFIQFLILSYLLIAVIYTSNAQQSLLTGNQLTSVINTTFPNLSVNVSGFNNGNRVIDNLPNNSASALFLVAGSAWLEVQDNDAIGAHAYPGGSYVAFDIAESGALVGSTFKIITYLNGLPQDSTVSSAIVSIDLGGRYRFGFYTSAGKAFNKVRIQYSAIGAGTVNVYQLLVQKFIAGPTLQCNQNNKLRLPQFPMSVASAVSGITLGNILNLDNVINADSTDYASIQMILSLAATANVSVKDRVTTHHYPGGTFVGFEIENNNLIDLNIGDRLQLRTYHNGVLQDSAIGGALLLSLNLLSSSQKQIVGFVTHLPVDEVRFTLAKPLGLNFGTTRVYSCIMKQFCTGSPLPCNKNVSLTSPAYPVTVKSSIAGGANVGIGSEISNTDALISSDTSDFAEIGLTVSVGAQAYLSVTDHITDYSDPNGTYVGFEIENDNLLDVSIAEYLSIQTYHNGIAKDTVAGIGALIGASILSNGSKQLIGFVTHNPVDEIRLVFHQPLGVSLGMTKVYKAVFRKFCEGAPLTCNTDMLMPDTAYPLYINAERTHVIGLIGLNNKIEDAQNILDNNPLSAATVNVLANVANAATISVKKAGTPFAAKTFAGFDISNTQLIGIDLLDFITISTYRNGVLKEQQTASSGALLSVNSLLLSGITGAQTVGFVTDSIYDEVSITFVGLVNVNLGETKIYNFISKQFCEGTIGCNGTYWLNSGQPADDRFPVFVNHLRTGIDGLACIGCSVNNSGNVVTPSSNDAAVIQIPVGVLGSASISVKDALSKYPAGTIAGFVIKNTNALIELDLLNALSISVYRNDSLKQSATGISLLNLEVLGLPLIGLGSGIYYVGLPTHTSFDEIQLKVTGLANVNLSQTYVYGAFVDTRNITNGGGGTQNLVCLVPEISPSTVAPICEGNTVTLTSSAPMGNQWYRNDTLITSAVGQTYAAGLSGLYSVKVNAPGFSGVKSNEVLITVDVPPVAGSISGNLIICTNGSSSLTASVAGGTWSSSNTNIATVNISTGLVSAVGVGSASITYTVSGGNSCADATTSVVVTVTAATNAGIISGNSAVCANSTLPLSATVSGGVWSSNNHSVATVDAATGLVTGAGAGVATISYTVTGSGGCGSATTTKLITVNALPIVNWVSVLPQQYLYTTSFTLTGATPIGGMYNGTAVTGSNFNPNAAGIGTHAITYTYTDANSCVSSASATISVVAGVPNALNDHFATPQGVALNGNVSKNDMDPQGASLTYNAVAVTTPQYGSVSIGNNGVFTYTPLLNYSGIDSFQYSVSNIYGLFDSAWVYISVVQPSAPGSSNKPPLVQNDAAITFTNVPVAGDVASNDIDPDGDTLTYVVVTQPVNGSITLQSDGTFIYTPNNGYSGNDKVVYMACDEGMPVASCASGVLIITVKNDPSGPGINDAPIANDDVAATVANKPISGNVLLNDSDPNGDLLVAPTTIGGSPGGFTWGINGNYTYLPPLNFVGNIVLTYSVCDNGTPSKCAQANLSIAVVAGVPVANTDNYATLKGISFTADVSKNDRDPQGATLTYATTVLAAPKNGSVIINSAGVFTYTPAASFIGVDSFQYKVGSALGLFDSAWVFVSVVPPHNPTGPNRPPIVQNDETTTFINVPVSGNVSNNDIDPDGHNLSYTISVQPTNGSIVIQSNGAFNYVPNPNFKGKDMVAISVSDDGVPVANSQSILTIAVLKDHTGPGINDAPIAIDDIDYTTKNTPISGNVLINDSDPNGDNLQSPTVVGAIPTGFAFSNNGNYTYTPPANFVGSVSLVYAVCDSGTPNACSKASLTIVVLNSNTVDAGVVGNHQTVCYQGDPAAFVTTLPATGSGTLSYQWQSSTTNSNCGADGFTNIVGATSINYNPPAGITATTYYRMLVTSTLEGTMAIDTTNCITVIVGSAINAMSTGTVSVQQNATTTSPVTFYAIGGVAPYTFNYQVNGGALQSITSTGANISIQVEHPNAVVGVFIYTLLTITDANGCQAIIPIDNKDTVTVLPPTGMPDLEPFISMFAPSFTNTMVTRPFTVNLFNIGNAASNGEINLYIVKPTLFGSTIDFTNLPLGWIVNEQVSYYELYSVNSISANMGVVSFSGLLTLSPSIPVGTNTLQVYLAPGSGGELNNANNAKNIKINKSSN